MGIPIHNAPSVFGYACPWCTVVVVDGGLLAPVRVFESHIDRHIAAGDQLRHAA